MIIDMVESLTTGQSEYPRALKAAAEFWATFYAEHGQDSAEDLKKAVEDAQMPFQWKLEETANLVSPFAKSIMALTAIAALYRDGFTDRALAIRMLAAIESSNTLSGGVKASVPEVRRLYGL